MWNASQEGGFMSDQISSPSVQGSGGKQKRAQNVIPVQIKEVLEAPEEGFTIEGMEVGMVVIVGKIIAVNKAATKFTYEIEDESGTVEAIQWLDEDSKEEEHMENSHVKVVGSIRTQGAKRHVMVFKITEITGQAEIQYHLLDTIYTHLKIKELQAKLTGQAPGFGDRSGLSNSMMGGALGSGTISGNNMMSSTNTSSFGHKHYDLVYSAIKQCVADEGIDINTIPSLVKGQMTKGEIDQAIEFLAGDGHIYTTVDEDHYKITDAD